MPGADPVSHMLLSALISQGVGMGAQALQGHPGQPQMTDPNAQAKQRQMQMQQMFQRPQATQMESRQVQSNTPGLDVNALIQMLSQRRG